ncbi:unnamed protein product [Phaedon cochleariae]|uniref:PIN domain-containing protein n=1 Tax=Phaedon cochleariae TaxID=80249 RepID=A0A9N9X183_PHACE|nr:unnamed protein product [Phaedon cochleariae]
MFNLILERCVAILQDHLDARDKVAVATTTPAAGGNLPSDAHVLLPAVKIWCDWMMCHTEVWNPPPSTQDFKIGCPGDAWSRLATLMNLLEKADQPATASFIENPEEVCDSILMRQVKLSGSVKFPDGSFSKDTVLTGFTPLMKRKSAAPAYAPAHLDPDLAHSALRISRLLFFGTMFLCGLEPPVLKLEIEDGRREYVSVVSQSTGGRGSPAVAALQSEQNNDVLLESFSEDEEDEQKEQITANASNEIRDLLTRKVELEKRQRSQDLHMQRVKKILSQSVVSVHMEIRPKYLVPDTNCFIDHLDGILTIAQSNCYTLMVPTVVLSELEGLSRGGRSPLPESRRHRPLDPQHVKRVAMCAKSALDLLRQRHSAVKCVTTKGAVLASTAFCTEEDDDGGAADGDGGARCNDDKILSTCLVVLLTDDRNLRVKAHAHDLPVRELPDFEAWAGLG